MQPSATVLREQARLLEEISLNAWPALQSIHYDGWLLRFADGYTRRANSVNALYPSTIDPVEKIAHCERVYAAAGLPVVYKITPAVQPENLDDLLAAQGYRQEALTSVQTCPLDAVTSTDAGDTTVHPHLTDAWLAAFCRLNGIDSRHVPAMMRLLTSVVPDTAFVSLHQAGEVAATGLGVAERGYVGIFDVVTAPAVRRQGLGTALMLHLLDWGKAHDASTAYLQVMTNNAPALSLYARLGFTEQYRYWYRIKRTS